MPAYLRDGQWLFVNGQLATGENCCCGKCCCINGQSDATKETQEECESAGGAWINSSDCPSVKCRCYCDVYLNICIEQVVSSYGFLWGGTRTPDTIPTSQPAGTLRVWSDLQAGTPGTGQAGCAGASGIRQNHTTVGWCYNTDVCNYDTGTQMYSTQWYYRARVVEDCADCGSAMTYTYVQPGDTEYCENLDPPEIVWGEDVCKSGALSVSCGAITLSACLASSYLACAGELDVSLCANEFP